MNQQKQSASFFVRRRNLIVGLAVMALVLTAGFFLLRAALLEEEPPVDPVVPELLPGEVMQGNALLLYAPIDRTKLKSVKIHNPANRAAGEAYVDWEVGFLYDAEVKDSYAYFPAYPYVEIDADMLAYFCSAVGTPVVSARLEDHCTDFSPYGLNKPVEELLTVTIETVDGTVHTLYLGDINPGGNGYYVRVADTVTDENGKSYVRDAVYLFNAAGSSYYSSTVAALPTAMLTKLMTFPLSNSTNLLSSFALSSSDGSIDISFLPVNGRTEAADLFTGTHVYRSVTPNGFFSSTQFETTTARFREFLCEEVMEFATMQATGEDEDGTYTYYYFPEEVLEKYGLDHRHIKYFMAYSALYSEAEEHLLSEVYFSDLQPDGYYYAYSLCYNTICRVSPATVDFLTWQTMDYLDAVALRMSIGFCEHLTVRGTIDGKPVEYRFNAEIEMDDDGDYILKSASLDGAGTLDLSNYRRFFMVLYASNLRGEVPKDLDVEALKATEPYFSFTITTPDVTVFKRNSAGEITNQIEAQIPSAQRVVRFYRYTNGRALMTVEMIEGDGTSSGESGLFYLPVSRLDKLIADAKKLAEGSPIDFYGRV